MEISGFTLCKSEENCSVLNYCSDNVKLVDYMSILQLSFFFSIFLGCGATSLDA